MYIQPNNNNNNVSPEWLDNICRHLVEHMNKYGICVIDNFLGISRGNAILREVQQIYENGSFQEGQLVNNRLSNIRGDKIIWLDGTEECCSEINKLMQVLDSVIINCNKMTGNNGEFDRHIINQRTKAMIACYPGNGTHYLKHVDNPNRDGRCITSIYYLNKNWDVNEHGGLLRLFPVGIDEVANIEPIFDRALFFWSDRRNPHEVQSSNRIRFAITLWYFDLIERREALERFREQQIRHQQQQLSDNNSNLRDETSSSANSITGGTDIDIPVHHQEQ